MRVASSPDPSWFRAVSDVMARVDTADFPAELVRVLRDMVPVDRALVYVLRREERPLILHTEQVSTGAVATRAHERYFRGGYRSDPYYRAFLAGCKGGFSAATEEPGASQSWKRAHHVAYLSPLSKDACAVALMVRTPGSRGFSAAECSRFRAVESVVPTALRLHWKTWAESQSKCAPAGDQMLHSQVEAALDVFGSCTLTPREGQVVRLLLRGRSTKAAAERLGIAVATTALHRKRAYAKLGVSSQAELFYHFIRSLAGPRRAEVVAEPARTPRTRPALVQSSWTSAAASGVS